MSDRHLTHFLDGYPLCWPQDREGEHDSTRVEADVTCGECTRLLVEP